MAILEFRAKLTLEEATSQFFEVIGTKDVYLLRTETCAAIKYKERDETFADVVELSHTDADILVSFLKGLAGIPDSGFSQEGRFSGTNGWERREIGVSTTPTEYGEELILEAYSTSLAGL
jgi:type II secretory ATPase GspE/PulE/Tfp pilus assembly ATPase PilB-like protein